MGGGQKGMMTLPPLPSSYAYDALFLTKTEVNLPKALILSASNGTCIRVRKDIFTMQ